MSVSLVAGKTGRVDSSGDVSCLNIGRVDRGARISPSLRCRCTSGRRRGCADPMDNAGLARRSQHVRSAACTIKCSICRPIGGSGSWPWRERSRGVGASTPLQQDEPTFRLCASTLDSPLGGEAPLSRDIERMLALRRWRRSRSVLFVRWPLSLGSVRWSTRSRGCGTSV